MEFAIISFVEKMHYMIWMTGYWHVPRSTILAVLFETSICRGESLAISQSDTNIDYYYISKVVIYWSCGFFCLFAFCFLFFNINTRSQQQKKFSSLSRFLGKFEIYLEHSFFATSISSCKRKKDKLKSCYFPSP